MKKIIHPRSIGMLVATLMTLGTAQAANFSKPVYDGAKAEVKSRFKVEREACSNRSGHDKDVCLEVAKGREKIALAQLDFNHTGARKDEMDLWRAKVDARYDIDREKCNALASHDKDVCVREAKTARDKSEADMKLAKKTDAAVEDADEAHLKADYKLAAEKCDALNGERKDVCMASAKAHYQQGW